MLFAIYLEPTAHKLLLLSNNASFMKTASVFLAVIMFAVACSSPKKTATKAESAPTVTSADKLVGGTSFSDPVVIMVQDERTGLDEEYKWLSVNYPGYSLVRRTHTTRSSRHYDIVRIKTKQGHLKDIYFDSTRFWGKK
jgi:hypothetical protein